MQPKLNSIWFAKMKNSIKHIFLDLTMSEFVENTILSTGFFGIECNNYSFEYISAFILDPDFEKEKNLYASGTTQEAINNKSLNQIYLLIPDEKTLKYFHEKTKDLFSSINSNKIQNKKLSLLRDTLLPKLMSGEIDVSNIAI
ncbi:restriction endonuclease subunit S [Oceanivirga salmonicida]|uniref:restriction endonuclease subunit S n=1 Tax=Oceanivirga salmonicida TaxID=1769291 RepID=UPI00082CA7BE|nr:restriction endonuclease subunit S [Oceanivirga salmonicida]